MKTNKLQRHDISLRLGILFLCTTILWLVLGINTYAEGTGRITTTIRIRAGAGTNTDVIGSAEMGTTVTITGKATDGNGAVWYQIVNDATSLGYVKGEYVEAVTGTIPDVSGATSGSSSTGSEPATPEPVVIPMDPVSAMTNQDNARVRQNPSDASEVVETIGMDVSLTVDGQITGDDGYIWYRVSFTKDGVSKTGYIRTDYLTISSTPEAPTTEDPATQQPTVVSEDY
ncbi:MAG: SH3 domain-containing protein, partial [Lachnospiraceae bacterium]|nr:SH3 domain-containing protein [Lachnospiraceae bacterium]